MAFRCIAVAALAAAVGSFAAGSARAADFTWSGGEPPNSSAWSTPDNWAGTAPSGSVGTLSFPFLAAATCTSSPTTRTCYRSDNDLAGLSVTTLAIDQDGPYFIAGSGITLGAGGIDATASRASPPPDIPHLHIPITLGAPQTWSIDGGPTGRQLMIEARVTGTAADTLAITFARQSFLDLNTLVEVGAVTASGAGNVALYDGASLDGSNGRPVRFEGGAGLFVVAGTAGIGDVAITDALVQNGYPGSSATLAVAGGVDFGAGSGLSTFVNGSTASRISATGDVDVAGAGLGIGTPSGCPSLPPGKVYTLVSAASVTGTFDGVPDGTELSLCTNSSGETQTVRIDYAASAITATAAGTAPPGSGGTRSSATGVACDRLGTGTFRCTATVADASGQATPKTPTGTVAFALDAGAGGVFTSGATCNLAPSTSGSTAYCSVDYEPGVDGVPTGTQPRLSGTYGGNADFASSSGRPQNRFGSGPVDANPTPDATALTPLAPPAPPANPMSSSAPSSAPCRATRMLRRGAATRAVTGFAAGVLRPERASAVTEVGTRGSGGHQVSRARAQERARSVLHPSSVARSKSVALFGLAHSLAAGSVVAQSRFGAPSTGRLRLRERAWLFWLDEDRLARFEHPSVMLLVSATTGHVIARAAYGTYPVVAGRTARFVGSRDSRYVVYGRGPRTKPPHISDAAFKRIRSAQRFAKGQVVAQAHAIASQSDRTTSRLVVLTDQTSHAEGDTFANERAAIKSVFMRHGVPVSGARDVGDLTNIADDAAKAGTTNLTLFIDGHGEALSTRQPRYPLVALGTIANGVEKLQVTSSDLVDLVRAHPDIKFNFIIDACYSGRFVDPLSAEANVASVTASSSATEPSLGPTKLYDTPTTTDPKLSSSLVRNGKTYYLGIDKSPSAVSNFTAAETKALEEAFTAAEGKDVDLTDVLLDAQAREPSYDLGAESGFTHPSPKPTPGASCPTRP